MQAVGRSSRQGRPRGGAAATGLVCRTVFTFRCRRRCRFGTTPGDGRQQRCEHEHSRLSRRRRSSFETKSPRPATTRSPMSRREPSYISRHAGASVKTGNPLDVAVQGDGWIAISTRIGVAYTRDGRMRMSETGALENPERQLHSRRRRRADPAQPAGGVADASRGDGMIAQDGKQIGAIGLFAIDDDAKLSSPKFRRHPRQAGDADSRLHQERRQPGVRRRRERQSDPGDDETDRRDAGLRQRCPAGDPNRERRCKTRSRRSALPARRRRATEVDMGLGE